MNRLNQKGFSPAEGLLVVAVVLLFSLGGYYVWNKNQLSVQEETQSVYSETPSIPVSAADSSGKAQEGNDSTTQLIENDGNAVVLFDSMSIQVPMDWTVSKKTAGEYYYYEVTSPAFEEGRADFGEKQINAKGSRIHFWQDDSEEISLMSIEQLASHNYSDNPEPVGGLLFRPTPESIEFTSIGGNEGLIYVGTYEGRHYGAVTFNEQYRYRFHLNRSAYYDGANDDTTDFRQILESVKFL